MLDASIYQSNSCIRYYKSVSGAGSGVLFFHESLALTDYWSLGEGSWVDLGGIKFFYLSYNRIEHVKIFTF
jgi:hypothetical protein